MKETTKIYGRITGITFLSVVIATVILILITGGNLFLFMNFIQLILLIPALLIVFIIFFVIQRTKYANSITKKKVNIICLVFVIVVIIFSGLNYYQVRVPDELLYEWCCDEGQEVCEYGKGSVLYLEKTWGHSFHVTSNWGPHKGYFIRPNSTFEKKLDFGWGYDNLNNILTMHKPYNSNTEVYNESTDRWENMQEWEVQLRLDVTSSGKMTTYYVSSNNAPFDANFFDGVSWTGKNKT